MTIQTDYIYSDYDQCPICGEFNSIELIYEHETENLCNYDYLRCRLCGYENDKISDYNNAYGWGYGWIYISLTCPIGDGEIIWEFFDIKNVDPNYDETYTSSPHAPNSYLYPPNTQVPVAFEKTVQGAAFPVYYSIESTIAPTIYGTVMLSDGYPEQIILVQLPSLPVIFATITVTLGVQEPT